MIFYSTPNQYKESFIKASGFISVLHAPEEACAEVSWSLFLCHNFDNAQLSKLHHADLNYQMIHLYPEVIACCKFFKPEYLNTGFYIHIFHFLFGGHFVVCQDLGYPKPHLSRFWFIRCFQNS